MSTWDPQLYLQFEKQRTQPCIDLVARIDLPSPRLAIDLGCGPGNSTAVLARRFPNAAIEGIDSSPEMIAKARASNVRAAFSVADIGQFSAVAKYDVILSNAALQWLPDHAALIPRLITSLAVGGVLAAQIPYHVESPVHELIAETARHGPWASVIGRLPDPLTMHSPAEYYEFASEAAKTIELWTTQYVHVMQSVDDIIEWISGTGLRPYLQALNDELRPQFVAAYREKLLRAYKPQSDGRVLFPFRRLFLLVTR